MANPRLDTPMMMNNDDMLAIETDQGQQRPNNYPALMNNVTTTNSVAPYVPHVSAVPNNRAMVPASKALVSPNNHVMTNNHINNLPQLDYGHPHPSLPAPAQNPVMRAHPQQIQTPDKYGLINNPNYEHVLKKNGQALPAIMAPNTGAVQPYLNGINGISNDHIPMELEYANADKRALEDKSNSNGVMDNNQQKPAENKKSNGTVPTTSSNTTSNNGVIKVAMVVETSMSNFHQCK